MVAYHFPPLAGSSGIQRTLRFVQHLPSLGWQPIVLTAQATAYESTSDDLLAEVPTGVAVTRAFALDTARHLSLFRRYPAMLARPDRWLSWKWGAVPAGLRLVRTFRPAAIWSTYPIATAHLIGASLSRKTGLPWIADFRDPMAQNGYPADPRTWRSFKSIEETAIRNAARCVFVTPGAARMYRERYPDVSAERLAVIENGYDEESFQVAEAATTTGTALHSGKITLLHSGIVYPSERDPTYLFESLQMLKRQGTVSAAGLRIRFRAAAHEGLLRQLATAYGIEDLLELVPPIPYRTALEEMLRADGLIVLQASNCNEQIPAKLYEYLRARRPIIGLTDPAGDTAAALRAAGIDAIAPLDSSIDISRALNQFLEQLRSGRAPVPTETAIRQASRRHRACELAGLLDQAAG
jgi:glycosyltransferase involved in cell wall biosynthesis